MLGLVIFSLFENLDKCYVLIKNGSKVYLIYLQTLKDLRKYKYYKVGRILECYMEGLIYKLEDIIKVVGSFIFPPGLRK